MNDTKFSGAPYPIRKSPRGLLATQHGLELIKSDLLSLLMTNPGERIMMPTRNGLVFGTPLRSLVFEPGDSALVATAKNMIIEAIKAWEPRVTISAIDVNIKSDTSNLPVEDSPEDLGRILSINIQFFDPEQIQEVQALVLELPLGGSSN